MPDDVPRIAPGNRAAIGVLNTLIARVLGAATGGGPPNVFTTLARNRRLFRPWLRFASGLMPGGSLPRSDTELVILRVAHTSGCEYEWHHHARLAIDAGLTADQVEQVRTGTSAEGWTPRQALLLRVADELCESRTLSAATWAPLRAELGDAQIIELCLLVGHYVMLAMTINALAIQTDPPPTRAPNRILVAAQARLQRGPKPKGTHP
jgi:AhpD family alkylhydroperoxidase